ncbi:YceD family protein [Roseateles sp. GG27B]
MDADSEDDVLVLPRYLDAQELVEDELLLALPLVPRHEQCPQPLALPAAELLPDGEDADALPHPFAALAALRVRTPKQ